jgi:hypothetical protein
MRSMVEGRERSELFGLGRRGAPRRPSTMLRIVPLPCKSRGGFEIPPPAGTTRPPLNTP